MAKLKYNSKVMIEGSISVLNNGSKSLNFDILCSKVATQYCNWFAAVENVIFQPCNAILLLDHNC